MQINSEFLICYDNYVLTTQNQLLKLEWNKNSLQIHDSKQNVCKGIPIYIKQKQNELIIVTQSNEIIKTNINNFNAKKQEKQNQITQVKCDFYNTFYKTDSHPLGFCCNKNLIAVITSEYIYWI